LLGQEYAAGCEDTGHFAGIEGRMAIQHEIELAVEIGASFLA